MKTYRKTAMIRAIQWLGDWKAMQELIDGAMTRIVRDGERLHVETPEGVLTAQIGDWIARGVKNELYPIQDEIFAASYEEVRAENER